MKLFLRITSVPLLLTAFYLAFRGSFLLRSGGAVTTALLCFGAAAVLILGGAVCIRCSMRKKRSDLSGNNPKFHRLYRNSGD